MKKVYHHLNFSRETEAIGERFNERLAPVEVGTEKCTICHLQVAVTD
jgi:hypothetical protein